jgi:hypothetical protein
MTAAHALDGLVEEMLSTAGQIAICVKDRDADGVRDALTPVLDAGDRDRIAALIIALAALVPDDQTYSELLAWTRQDQLPYGELVVDPLEKWCPSCRQVRSRLVDFHVDRSRRDGLYARCRHCVADEYQERKARAEREQQERDRREAVA